jgi:hypothetical protein
MTCAPRVTKAWSMTADDCERLTYHEVIRSLLVKRATDALIGLQRLAGLKLAPVAPASIL